MKLIVFLIAGFGLLSSCASSYNDDLTQYDFTEGVRKSTAAAQKTIAVTENKISAEGFVLLAPMVQAFEFDAYGADNDPDFYSTWRAEAKSSDFPQIQRDLYQKTLNRLAGKKLKMVSVNQFRAGLKSLGVEPQNPTGSNEGFNYRPYTFSSDSFELEKNNTDAVKSVTGADAVIYVSLHSIWKRNGYINLFGHTINYGMHQWMRVTVCKSSSNCVTSLVPQDNGRFTMQIPVPFYYNGREQSRLPGSDYAIGLYTNSISEIVEAAVLSLLM